MLDGTPTWHDELAAIQRDKRDSLEAYFRNRLADTQAARKLPQTRDDHAILADREAHYHKLLGWFQ